MKIDMGGQTDELQIQELKQRVKNYSDQISMLSESKARLSRYCDTTDLYRKKNERLTKKVKQLSKRTEEQKQRIKRLQEAGDKLHWAWMNPFDPAGETIVDNWRKAKEDKP